MDKKEKRPELEEILRRRKYRPGEKVKRSVMDEFAGTLSNRPGKGFWYRGIPLYQAAAATLLIALASAFGGSYFTSIKSDSWQAPPTSGIRDSIPTFEAIPAMVIHDIF